MRRYEAETNALAADIIATLNLPKNASKGPMPEDCFYLNDLLDEEWKEFEFEIERIYSGHGDIDAALRELSDMGAILVGFREALIKLRGSNEDATVEDQEMVAGWEQDNVPGS